MSLGIEQCSRGSGEIELIDDLRQLTDFSETREHYSGIYFTKDWVIKTKNRFTPEQVVRQYQYLQQSGIPIGAPPRFIQDKMGNKAELDQRIPGPNGADYLLTATDVEAIEFLTHALMPAVDHVLEQTPDQILSWSIDNLPHNFVFDPNSNDFRYIDYEPSHLGPNHSHFLNPSGLVNYTLVKFAREKPHLLEAAISKITEHFQAEISTHVLSRPYVKLLHQPRYSLSLALEETGSKDDLMGLLLAWISRMDQVQIVKTRSFLKESGYSINTLGTYHGLVQLLAYEIGKNNPESLRRILSEIAKP